MSRFYIPRRRSPVLDIAGLALRYADIKQRGDIAKKGQKLTERELELRERESKSEYGFDMQTKHPTEGVITQHQPGLAERRVKTGERYADIGEAEAERKERDYTVQWERRMDEPPQPANLINLKERMPAFAPMINSILEGIQTGKINSRWDAYYDRKQNEAMDLKTARDAVEKQISKATKDGKHTEAAQLGQLYNALKPGFLEDFFGFPKALREARPEMGTGATTEKAYKSWVTPDGKVVNLPNNVAPPEGAVPYKTGMDIEVTDEGTRIRTGVSGVAGGMQRKTAGTLEDKILNTVEGIQRLDQIAESYRPEYQELGTRWQAFATKWKEKLRGTPIEKWVNLGISTEEKGLLQDYTAYRRDAIDNINRHIKEITGARMGIQEAKRIRKGMPDPGEGLFDGDSPTEFEAKLKSSTTALRMSQARYVYLLKTGMTEDAIRDLAKKDMLPSLGNMKIIINEKADEIKTANPGITIEQLKLAVSKYFGLTL